MTTNCLTYVASINIRKLPANFTIQLLSTVWNSKFGKIPINKFLPENQSKSSVLSKYTPEILNESQKFIG